MRIFGLVASCACLVIAGTYAEELPPSLGGSLTKDRDATITAIRRQREAIADGLMDVVRRKVQSSSEKGAMEAAVFLLGELRIKESIPLLVQNITFSPPGNADHPNPFPCVLALVGIGTPSVLGIVDRLGAGATDEELGLFAFVVEAVDGKELGSFRLEQLLKKEASEVRKANLQKLLEKVMAGAR